MAALSDRDWDARRCRSRAGPLDYPVGGGALEAPAFGFDCVGSSIGLMLVALGVMSVTCMSVIAVVGLAQKLLPARAAIDVAHDELTRRSDELARWRRAVAGGRQGESARRFRGGFGTDLATYTREAPGMSEFALEDGAVYHTYSAYTRGLDGL